MIGTTQMNLHPPSHPEAHPTPKDRYVQVHGQRIRYWQLGESGEPVVLIHGIACSVLEWRDNIDALARHHRVLVMDLPGFGLSDKPLDGDYSLSGLARFVLAFMSALGADRAHLAGNSLGGRLALECARQEPARVASLLLVDPAGIAVQPTLLEFRLATLPVIGAWLSRPSKLGTRMLWRKAFARPDAFVSDAMVQSKLQLARLPGAHAAFLKTLRSFVDLRGFREDLVNELQDCLPQITCPTLVIWGQQDQFVPAAHADILRDRLPSVHVQIWQACGHAAQVEMADRFNEVALNFWSHS